MTAPLRYRVRTRLSVRSTWAALVSVLAAGSSLVATSTAVRLEMQDRQEAAQECDQRTESRAEVRQAIEAAVDEVARFAQLDDVTRAEVVARAERRVAAELPPPDC